jgi:hypothetical protein
MAPNTLLEWILYFIIPAILLDFFLMRWWQRRRARRNLSTGKSVLFEWIRAVPKRVLAFFSPPGPDPLHPNRIPWTIHTLQYHFPQLVEDRESTSSDSPALDHPQKKRGFRYTLWKWVTMIAFLVFAIAGQAAFFNYPEGETSGLRDYAISAVFYILLIWHTQSSPRSYPQLQDAPNKNKLRFKFPNLTEQLRKSPGKFICFCGSLVLALLAMVLLVFRSSNQYYWDIFILWAASWICFAVTLHHPVTIHLRDWIHTHKTDLLNILLLTAIGAAIRFYALGHLPNTIDGDEGRFGTIILDILQGRLKNMFITTFGNSTMYFFFLAGMMKLFGVNITTLRIGSALGGTLTIPFLYLLAKLMANRRVAWISTIILLVSSFHVHFSRIMSVTGVQDALFATMSIYWLYSGLIKHSRNRMILGGISLGIALYVYMGARLIILLLPIYILFLFFFNRKLVTDNLRNILIFFSVMAIVTLPMIYWAVRYPDLFNARANQVGILQSGWLAQESLNTGLSQFQVFGTLFKQAFLTTIFYPSFGFHNSRWPMLDMFSSIFFVAGLLYSLLHTRKASYLLLNGWFWSGILVGGAMVILPSYNSYRILIVFPVMCLFAGIGMDRLIQSNTSKILFFLKSYPLSFWWFAF